MVKDKRLLLFPLLAIVLGLLALINYNDGALIENTGLSSRTYKVGFRSFELTYINDNGISEQLSIAIWYPTSSVPKEYTYDNGEVSVIALDGTAAQQDNPYPLVIFNHGLGADELDPIYLKEYLASEGYIVISCDYSDNLWGTITNLFDPSLEQYDIDSDVTGLSDVAANLLRSYYIAFLDDYRFGQTTFMIDEAIRMNHDSDSFLFGKIDETAVGMSGHSLGGLNTLGLIGSHPNSNVKDDRIKAALLLASPIYPFDTTIDKVSVPLMLMAGEYDVLATQPESSWWCLCDLLSTPNYYLVLEEAHHFTFSQAACDNYRTVGQCQDDNQQVNTILDYALAFFDYYLKGNNEALGKITSGDDDMLTAYEWANVS
jgi:predicted dienelactone hydrolase